MLTNKQKRLIFGSLLLLTGILVLLSLSFYSSSRSYFFTSRPELTQGNYVGYLGSRLATYLFLFLGIGAFVVPFALLRWGISQIKRGLPENLFFQGLGYILFLIGFCSLLHQLGVKVLSPILYGLGNLSDGGILGLYFSQLLTSNFGQLGGCVIMGTSIFLSLVLNHDFSLARKKKKIRQKVLKDERIQVLPPRKRRLKERKERDFSSKEKNYSLTERLPPLSLLDSGPPPQGAAEEVELAGNKLRQTLKDFGIEVQIEEIKEGPVVTRYEVHLAPGIKVSRVMNLSSDLALALAVPSVRIEVPVSGKPLVGIEVPKKKVDFVYLRPLLEEKSFRDIQRKLLFPLGKDIAGETVWVNLESLPHLLIGGSTGSGKSVCINSIIVSLLFRSLPEEVKFLLIDPKTVELVDYLGIPHLIFPPVKEVKEANIALEWVVNEMKGRYERFGQVGVRNINGFNQEAELKQEPALPYLVVVIDELADLIMLAGVRLEKTLCRIAQLGRATGIHLIVATQRPSVDVITGLIKANFPSRLSFSVASQVDSRTILDTVGSERLVGNGDMLFSPVNAPQPFRVQGTFVSPQEVKRVVAYLRKQGEPTYYQEVLSGMKEEEEEREGEYDELYNEAKELILGRGEASTSFLQRRLSIGYNRSARIMEQLEKEGVVGPPRGSKAREVLMNPKGENEFSQ